MEQRMAEVAAGYVNRHPGEVLARAFSGETILITQYGRPYAVVGPPPADAQPAEEVPSSG